MPTAAPGALVRSGPGSCPFPMPPKPKLCETDTLLYIFTIS